MGPCVHARRAQCQACRDQKSASLLSQLVPSNARRRVWIQTPVPEGANAGSFWESPQAALGSAQTPAWKRWKGPGSEPKPSFPFIIPVRIAFPKTSRFSWWCPLLILGAKWWWERALQVPLARWSCSFAPGGVAQPPPTAQSWEESGYSW